MEGHRKIPLEFDNVLEEAGEEALDIFNQRLAKGQPFNEDNEDALKEAAQTRVSHVLEEMFTDSDYEEQIFEKHLLTKKVRPELANSRYVSFKRLNKDAPLDRQVILVRLDLPRYYQEVVGRKAH